MSVSGCVYLIVPSAWSQNHVHWRLLVKEHITNITKLKVFIFLCFIYVTVDPYRWELILASDSWYLAVTVDTCMSQLIPAHMIHAGESWCLHVKVYPCRWQLIPAGDSWYLQVTVDPCRCKWIPTCDSRSLHVTVDPWMWQLIPAGANI